MFQVVGLGLRDVEVLEGDESGSWWELGKGDGG